MDNQVIQESTVPLQTDKTLKPRSKWILIALFGLFMLLLGIGGGLLLANKNYYTWRSNTTVHLSPSPQKIYPTIKTNATNNEISNWKTYASSKYLFTIKHPNDLNYYEDDNSQSISFYPAGKKENETAQREIHIFVSSNPSKLSASEYWITRIQTDGRPNKPITQINREDLDAIKVESFGLDHKRLSTIIIATNTLLYEITFNEYEAPISTYNKSISDDVFIQMLNSFQRLNK